MLETCRSKAKPLSSPHASAMRPIFMTPSAQKTAHPEPDQHRHPESRVPLAEIEINPSCASAPTGTVLPLKPAHTYHPPANPPANN